MRWLPFILALPLLGGCNLVSSSASGSVVVDDKEYSFDAVKLISPSITSEDDADSFQQSRYRVGPNARLLFRLEEMLTAISSAVVSDEHPIEVVMWVADVAQAGAAQGALRLCPLQKNWMMLATWQRAYPFARDGVWSVPGGDYSELDCMPVTTVTGTQIRFNVNSWVQNEVRGRSVNQGLVLVSTAEVDLEGDRSASVAPRLKWTATTRVD